MTKTAITRESLESMTLAGLTEVYNKFAAKPIKKFSCSKDEAIAKIEAVLPQVEAKPAKAKNETISAVILKNLKAGMGPKDTLAAVQLTFPTAKTTIACVYWFKSRLNRGFYS